MEEFRINSISIKNYSHAIKGYSKELQKAGNNVGDIRTCLRSKIVREQDIRGRLREIERSLDEINSDVKKYAVSLANIVNLYNQTEDKIVGKAVDLEAISGIGSFVLNQWGHIVSFNEVKDIYINGKKLLETGFKITEKNGYYIISGGGKNLKLNEAIRDDIGKIKRGRYKYGSEKYFESGLYRYVPAGSSPRIIASKFCDNIKNKGIWKDSFKDFSSKAYGIKDAGGKLNIGNMLAYAGIALDTATGIYQNVQNGESGSKITADAVTDVAKGLGGMAVAAGCAQVGAAIGTAIPVPVVGTVVGAAVGFGLGLAGEWIYGNLIDGIEIGDKTVAGWVSAGIEKGINEITSDIKHTYNFIKSYIDAEFENIAMA